MLAHGAEVQVVQPLATWVTLNMILHPLEGREQHLSPLEVAAVSFGDRMNLVRTLMGVVLSHRVSLRDHTQVVGLIAGNFTH